MHLQGIRSALTRLALAFGALVLAGTAAAQQQAWQQGMRPEQAGSTLAPLPGKLTVTPAADIPVGSGRELVATGVRNSHGLDWHPVTKELWFTRHGRDWLGDDSPHDILGRVSGPGQKFGVPSCHEGTTADPDVKRADACAGVQKPVALLGPHAAAMGVQFYTGFMDPATQQYWGRPTFFRQMKDGSLLISDEQTSAVDRISYAKP